jgi:hypothetical protein
MFAPVDTRSPQAVEAEVDSIFCRLFGDGHQGSVARAFGWAALCFRGEYPGYQAIDARYHDFEHTLQGTLCLARLLEGWQLAGSKPELSRRLVDLSLVAILFHDTGYLKKAGDNEGTGAKYTLTHVARSAEFAGDLLTAQGYAAAEVQVVRNMISCTGLNTEVAAIPFRDESERLLGFAVATADLLGQMAAADYVDKLPVLYLEFAEAARHDGGAGRRQVFRSAEELVRNTPVFWESYVVPLLKETFRGLYRFLNDPYPDGPNAYVEQIERNLGRIRAQFRD